jgi:chemotaxis signal transduction protein
MATSPEALLEQRAAALARPEERDEGLSPTDVVVVSVAGGLRYAVETRYVRQAVRSRSVSMLPGSASELVGLMLVRDEAVPVADLATVLGLAATDVTRPFVVVVGVDEPPVGLLVDEVLAAEGIPDAHLRGHQTGGGASAGLEVGMTSGGVVLLDGRALLDDDRLRIPAATTLVPPGRSAASSRGEP